MSRVVHGLCVTAHSIASLCALWRIGPFTFLLFIILLAVDSQGILYCFLEYCCFPDQLLFVFFIFRNKFSVRFKISCCFLAIVWIAFLEMCQTSKLKTYAWFWCCDERFLKRGASDHCRAGHTFSWCSSAGGGMWIISLQVWKIFDLWSPIFEIKLGTCHMHWLNVTSNQYRTWSQQWHLADSKNWM